MIVTKCPLRISLVGGSTDLEEFIQTFGIGSVISFPSTLYVYVTLHKNHRNKIIINYSSKEEVKNIESIKNDVVRVIMQHFKKELDSQPNKKHVTITFNSDIISHGSGLATSSAYMIATIKAFASYLEIDLSDFEICKLAIKLERQFNPLTGYQDTYGCGISGFKRIIFEKDKRPKFRYFETNFLKNNFDICLLYTGIKRSSTEILKSIDVNKSYFLLELVEKMEEAIDNRDANQFLNVFNQAWITKRQSSSMIFDEIKDFQKFDTLFNNEYVLGYKLLGAGAGGYFLLFLKKDSIEKVKEQCTAFGIEHNPIPITVSETGVKEFII